MREKEKYNDPFDGEYIGNIWGWKISFWGLALILVLVAFMWYRHQQVGEWGMIKKEQTVTTSDSLRIPKDSISIPE